MCVGGLLANHTSMMHSRWALGPHYHLRTISVQFTVINFLDTYFTVCNILTLAVASVISNFHLLFYIDMTCVIYIM